MTRKEEIEQAAFKYTDNWYKKHDMVKSAFPVDVAVSEFDFKAGAEWADKNPSKEVVEEFLQEDRDCLATYFATRELCKKEFINKACEWLKENKDHPFIGCEDHQLAGYLTDDFINDFRKTMEE